MKTNLFRIVLSLFVVSGFISCSKDDPATDDGISALYKYEDFVDASTENILINQLGITIHKGIDPPVIEGKYLASPFLCKKSNFSDGYEGRVFGATDLYFYNQNKKNLTIDLQSLLNYGAGWSTKEDRWDGTGCFISGEGNKFSVFFHSNGSLSYTDKITVKFKNLIVLSGELVVDDAKKIKGIKDFQMASIMADDYGDEYNRLIENGQGRLFVDSDNFVMVVE